MFFLFQGRLPADGVLSTGFVGRDVFLEVYASRRRSR